MELFLREVIRIVAGDARLVYFVDTMILGSVLISILLLVRPWIGKLSRAGMYVLWIAVGLRLLIPVNLFNFFPEEVRDDVAAVTEQIKVHQIETQFQLEELDQLGGRENGYRLSPELSYADIPDESGAVSEESSHTGSRKAAETFLEVMGTVWALGLIFLVVYILESLLWTRLRLCDAKLVDEDVYTHPVIRNSFVLGFSTPRIYVSEQVAASDRRYVICHEKVHIKRYDYRIKPLMFLLCSVFWISPLMWVAYRCMVEDMEISCDEAVLRRFGEHRKKEYSTLLLQMSAASSGYRREYVSFCTGKVKKRICHILRYHEPGKVFSLLGIIFTCCAMGGILSVPGASAVGFRQTLAKSVYVEQSFCYPEEEDLYGDSGGTVQSRKGVLYMQEEGLYTGILQNGQICSVARRCGGKWHVTEISSGLRQQIDEKEKRIRQWSDTFYVGAGKGFYVLLDREGEIPRELVVCNAATDHEEYRIPLGPYVKGGSAEERPHGFQAGVTGNRIYFVCDQGIFETVYGSQEVVKMVSATADNVYYLSDDQSEYYDIVRGEHDDYYVAVGQNGKQMICHYGIRKVRVNRG